MGGLAGCHCGTEEEDDEEEPIPDLETILKMVPSHKRASIARSLASMGEMQQARALGTLL